MFLAVYEAEVGPQTGEAPDRRASRARPLTLALAFALAAWLAATGTPAQAQTSATAGASANPELILEAQDALRQKNRARLSALNVAAQELKHPLAPWVDYWQLGLRLAEASQSELDAFYARWPGSYVEDRLRNDWLLELGRRRDWKNFANDHTRYQMRDDREVVCYALLAEHFNGRPVARESARAAWLAQRDAGEGCGLLASTWLDNKQFSQADIWLKLRLSLESLKLPAARQAAKLLGKPTELALKEILDNPTRYMARKAQGGARTHTELATLGLMRLAAADPSAAAEAMAKRWERELPQELQAWAWAQIGRQAAFKLQPEASDYFERALKAQGRNSPEWSEDTRAWVVRAALRSGRWAQALQGLNLLTGADDGQREGREAREARQARELREARDLPPWPYWRARALLATAAPGAAGETQREEARKLLRTMAEGPQAGLNYYGRLAAEELGLTPNLPAAPSPLSPAERAQAQAHAGLSRALLLINAGLRSEGNREWNYSLRGLNDRELRAAAQLACERELWDRCINSSDRSRQEFDLAQRFPTPFRNALLGQAREAGLDPAFVYGLIRQESRFIADARSSVGATGLMQVMPATARWTAKKAGLSYSPELMKTQDFNLRIGTHYLKLVLDDFGGSYAMAAAAYNAGPGRPRRWRDGPVLEAAIWAENVPFIETRDYVKKVLTNSAVYAQLLGLGPEASSLKSRLGRSIGPRSAGTDIVPEEQPQP
ncbi:lytic transglycosylase domain-containing protein [Paucibacter sp. DJ2R-2]|uniref:lytic transglycosylase domain-containing protein n=1 Tax=Paucibacter sp. DJ2R-2 TaxID=2893558 RepID=UPI0021E3BEC1|nr:lytic transglycosylase domain-containing protein [Paucibacter sp. DJ2R-2]MCV2437233.1 lytic transglycosylase domain-containing protein [Paucibacter sp. DJ2R-2]